MSIFKTFFILLFLCSCSGYPYKKIPVESKEQASLVINNHLSFLREIFTQSHDPYYGNAKWTEECLFQNKIGQIQEEASSLRAESFLFVDHNNEVGQCSGEHKYLLYVYCDGDSYVREAWFSQENYLKIGREKLCD